ncbi:hypothetical protein [Robiginitalea sp.]|uniref:hypothetical protein n=1 Tax=Robiginitalea sp. TaxID=1902411 RepID=UPI003C789B7D
MKKISLLLVAAALLISGNVMATEGDPGTSTDPESKICTQIGDLLDNNSFELQEDGDLTAFVRFTVNDNHEIVVLSVDTDNDRLEGFVKARLNYSKVADQNVKEGKIYYVPIRIRA